MLSHLKASFADSRQRKTHPAPEQRGARNKVNPSPVQAGPAKGASTTSYVRVAKAKATCRNYSSLAGMAKKMETNIPKGNYHEPTRKKYHALQHLVSLVYALKKRTTFWTWQSRPE